MGGGGHQQGERLVVGSARQETTLGLSVGAGLPVVQQLGKTRVTQCSGFIGIF